MSDSRTAKRWWVHFPGAVYANNFDFEEEVDLKAAKKAVRNWLGKGRKIPRQTQFWPGDLHDHLP